MRLKKLKVLNLTITGQCNMKCKHCGAVDCMVSKEKRELTTEEYISVINQAVELGCRNIIIAGGEPFLRKDIFDILKFADSRNIVCSILSNGLLINEEIIGKLEELRNFSYVRISLDYVDNKKMEEFRGVEGIVDKVIKVVKLLVNNKIRVGVGMTIMPDNLHEIESVATLAKEIGADFFRAVPVVPIGRAQEITIDKNFYVDALMNVLKANAKLQPNYFGTNFLPNDLRDLYSDIIIKCPGGEYIASLTVDGYMTRCPLSSDTAFPNSIREESLSSLWGKMISRKLKEEELFYQYGSKKCKNCEIVEKCLGACHIEKEARNYNNCEQQPICMKDIWTDVLSKLGEDRSNRRVVNNILCLYDSNRMYNVPMCYRSVPLWWFPLRKVT